MKDQILIGWSGGKDSTLTLHELRKAKTIEIAALLTTVNEDDDRISKHGIRRNLFVDQADALGYPLEEIAIPRSCANDVYEQRMQQASEKHRQKGIARAAFGDLFLQWLSPPGFSNSIRQITYPSVLLP